MEDGRGGERQEERSRYDALPSYVPKIPHHCLVHDHKGAVGLLLDGAEQHPADRVQDLFSLLLHGIMAFPVDVTSRSRR